MSRVCQLTGARPSFGNAVPHSHHKSRRRWDPNLTTHRLARSAAGDDDRTIVVSELACTEPGCPPLETVIGLLAPGRQTQFKVHKPLAEVTEADVIAAFARGDHDHTEEPR